MRRGTNQKRPAPNCVFPSGLDLRFDGLISKGKSVVDGDCEPEQKFRRAVDAFLRFVEDEPDAARVLLTIPSGDPAAARVSREVQAGASAGIAALLVAFMPGSPVWRLRATSEFLKEGLHALAVWWLENPGKTRDEIVDVVMRLVWPGLQAGAQTTETP
ncbi:hypothetical protein [Mesorhizobium sp. B2-3-5]|uniref:hypothetical protein n=1 Tax=Mesorhizobium sp. B2-3-5 TaxID=2589958 RepID=UPI00116C2D70|nr:hypothetical protein [Mesorhizobium sp. B2-3-5]TPM36746.1 hypothetical protein FJ958_02680 [Mesorhizobium sp. B2-3-5]